MRIRNAAVQVVLMVIAAMAIAIIANGFAARERRLVLPGYYPNAQRIPPRVPEVVPPPPRRIAPSPAPQPVPTTTTTRAEPATPPVTTTTTTAASQPPAPAAKATQRAAARPEPATAPVRAETPRFTPHPDKPYVEIGFDDVATLHRSGALFLDARRTSVFEEGHIAGARSFSVWESDIDDKVTALFNERSDPAEQNQPIVIYCSGGACEDSHMLAQKLWGIQFNNVYVYKDGFPDWQKHGGAVKTGENP